MKTLDLQFLYDSYGSEIRRYLRSKFGDGPPEPEDVVQAAFAKFAALSDPASVENPRAFLYAAARNITIDEHRRNSRVRAHHDQVRNGGAHVFLDEMTPERVLLSKEQLDTLQTAVAELPEAQRVALKLRRLDGLSYAAVAERLGMSETSVRRHVAAAMTSLLAALRRADLGARRARPMTD